jgi:hexosaminidase
MFAASLVLTLPLLSTPAIIPQPVSMTQGTGFFELNPGTVIVADAGARAVARLLSRTLSAATGYDFALASTAAAKENAIQLVIDPSLTRLGDEGYQLEVTAARVVIRAPKAAGVFYGTGSLRQLLPAEAYSPVALGGVAWRVPCVKVEDTPRFGWRGALVDVGRHFMPKAGLLRFIDAIAMLKLNVLQLHLTDDQGWRLEIRKYPKLTEVGSTRRETVLRRAPRGWKVFDGQVHAGFYTQQDMRAIVAYAAERHITVVPEIEMPGHSRAAIASYPELGNTDRKLEVATEWGVFKQILNANESTIRFCQDVLTEVMEIFPSKFIHVGGDEAPKDEWRASPVAQARIKELALKNEQELQSYFIRRMDQFLTAHGRRLIGWDEILEGGLAPGATVMSWRGIQGGITAARTGHDVVMTPTDFTYFDYYQSKDPDEPLGAGGFIPLERVYQYDPVPEGFTPDQARRVLGTQGQLWTERIATPHNLEYMAFPRLAALAEVAWTSLARKDYAAFLERLSAQQQRWRVMGVNFRP